MAQYFLKFSGKSLLHKTVKFGSGPLPKLVSVCKILKEFLVTSAFPLSLTPPIDSVTHVGSPLKSSSYSGVLKCLAIRSLITKLSINSWASASVIMLFFKSLSIYISKNVEVLPKLIAAPLFSFIAAR